METSTDPPPDQAPPTPTRPRVPPGRRHQCGNGHSVINGLVVSVTGEAEQDDTEQHAGQTADADGERLLGSTGPEKALAAQPPGELVLVTREEIVEHAEADSHVLERRRALRGEAGAGDAPG